MARPASNMNGGQTNVPEQVSDVIQKPPVDSEIDRVLNANPQAPIATTAEAKAVDAFVDIADKEEKADKCPKCGKNAVAVYGQCIACYDKLKPVEKRKLLLLARVTGVNTHEYPVDAIRVWKTELELIANGLWRGPLKWGALKKTLGQVAYSE